MSERDEVVADLRERARFFGALSGIGLPRVTTKADVAANAYPPRTVMEPPTAGPSLEAIRADIGDCQRCKLSKGRKNIVFGQGHPQAQLLFVGEAPGAEEDEQGLAFVGRAGQLLTKIIEAIGMTRDDVFIANVIKCRPPQNRNTEPDEISSCQPFLEAQIEAIRPRVLVGLGKFGAQWLLKTAEPISKLRGRFGDYKGIAVMPTYHPAYLLRNPGAKKDLWSDMQRVRDFLKEPA